MEKLRGADSWPSTLRITMVTVAGACRRLAGITAITCVGVTKRVVNGVPLKTATVSGKNVSPVIRTWVCGLPAGKVGGSIDVILGALARRTVKSSAFDTPPAALRTVI